MRRPQLATAVAVLFVLNFVLFLVFAIQIERLNDSHAAFKPPRRGVAFQAADDMLEFRLHVLSVIVPEEKLERGHCR